MTEPIFDDKEFLLREVLAFEERLAAAGDKQSINDIFGSEVIEEMDLSELQWVYDEYIRPDGK